MNNTLLKPSAIVRKTTALFFLYMLVFPTTYQIARGGILSLILLFSFVLLLSNAVSWKINRSILGWFFVCLICSIFFVIRGVMLDAPGATRVITVYVVWPILYIWCVGFCSQVVVFHEVKKIILLGTALAALLGILFVFSGNIPHLSKLYQVIYHLGGHTGYDYNKISYSLPNLPTVIYGLAFIVPIFFQKNLVKSEKIGIAIVFFLAIVALFCSGRRGFWLVAMVVVPLTLFLMYIVGVYKITVKQLVIFLAISLLSASAITQFFDLKFTLIYADFLAAFDFGDESNLSALVRKIQSVALIEGWADHFMLGSGLGGSANETTLKIKNTPWGYELSYLALLFSTGIIGVLVYASSVIWVLVKMLKLMKSNHSLIPVMMPPLVALICFLIVNGTNPYLNKFDYLFALFYPIGIINAVMTNNSADNYLASHISRRVV